VGVAHATRIPQRWIEQGANLAKRIIVGNGMDVRRYERSIHNAMRVLTGLQTAKKVDTLWKRQGMQDVHALNQVEQAIHRQFPDFPFYHEPLHDLSDIYQLPPLDRRPIALDITNHVHISGKILGAKGALLLLRIENQPYYLNLKHLVGRKITLKETNTRILQTALDRF